MSTATQELIANNIEDKTRQSVFNLDEVLAFLRKELTDRLVIEKPIENTYQKLMSAEPPVRSTEVLSTLRTTHKALENEEITYEQYRNILKRKVLYRAAIS